jgi:hypothetical protein
VEARYPKCYDSASASSASQMGCSGAWLQLVSEQQAVLAPQAASAPPVRLAVIDAAWPQPKLPPPLSQIQPAPHQLQSVLQHQSRIQLHRDPARRGSGIPLSYLISRMQTSLDGLSGWNGGAFSSDDDSDDESAAVLSIVQARAALL